MGKEDVVRWFGIWLVAGIAGNWGAGLWASPDQDRQPNGTAAWSVEDPPGDWGWKEVAIDVREGTWMALDVSPDGREIVFDLLGDLYLLPIEGGSARPVTSGLAWDMQPRFSPDGKRIAFISDRDGGNNVWTVARDGSDLKQVSKERERLVNSPAWSPDGEWIAVRKHFTKFRSLGAGEIWLYHRSGGKGYRAVEKVSDQKDLGEPAFSPDGRSIYFSQDVSPGPNFEYNRDSNEEIYRIRRLDRVTGEFEEIATGPGGAVTPTPSPDGKRLAFLRRVRGRSILFVQDLASQIERRLFERVDRDLQETWAIHGLYPGFAWTPDSREIVLWGEGRIHRVDAATGESREIPFQVRTTRKVARPLRGQTPVAPDQARATTARFLEVSWEGREAVYEMLGKLWIRALPGGTPQPLLPAETRLQAYPALSREGRFLAYATWEDDEYGALWILDRKTGRRERLSKEPGHYAELALAPDASALAYRKGSGDWLRGRGWSRDPGLFLIELRDGRAISEPRRLVASGEKPQFAGTGGRLYFLRRLEEDRRGLFSIGLHGERERQHAVSDAAVEWRVSPEGRYLAWSERFRVLVTRLPDSGRVLELSSRADAGPLAQLGRDGGESLRWSRGGAELSWIMGSRLYHANVAEAFEKLDRGEEVVAIQADDASSVDLSTELPLDRPVGRVAFEGARIVTLRGDEVLEDGVLVVSGHRIEAVGKRGEVPIPEGSRRIDAQGATILPGLVDVHWHGMMGSSGWIPRQNWELLASLFYGVTTLFDPSNATETIFAAGDRQRAGTLVGPRIFSTGRILYGALGDARAEVDSLEDALAHLRRMKTAGAIAVKSYNQPRRDQRQQILEAARRVGLMVVPEGGALLAQNLTQVVDGHTKIEHTVPVGRVYEDVLQLWSQTPVGYTPTLGVAFGGLDGEHYWYAKTEVWKEDPLARLVPRALLDARSRRRTLAPEVEWNHIRQAEVAAALARRGVEVSLGAHGQREGLAAHWELWSFVQGGMTPLEAWRAGSLLGARSLGFDREIGSLEPGKLADFVVLGSNPLEDIRRSTDLRWVVANGRVWDVRSLVQIWPVEKPLERLWFAEEPTAGTGREAP